MAGIDRLAEVMGVENDFDPVSQSKFLYEVADEIEQLRASSELNKIIESAKLASRITQEHDEIGISIYLRT